MPGMLLRDGARRWRSAPMGGDGQPQTMVQLVTGLVDDGLDPQAVVDRPRWVVSDRRTGTAPRAGQPRVGRVGRRGRWRSAGAGPRRELIEPRTPATGWAQVIRRRPDGSYEGGADPRADSLAAGLPS